MLFIQRRQFPNIKPHLQTTVHTTVHTLSAKYAAVNVIAQHKSFFFFIDHDHLDRICRAIHSADSTTSTFFWIPIQVASQPYGCFLPILWVLLCDWLPKKRVSHIAEHSSDFHKIILPPIMNIHCTSTSKAPYRHHKPTVWSIRNRASSACRPAMTSSKASVFKRKNSGLETPPR